MSKNIILLSDGTGNSNIKDRGTNVFKLYEALDFNSGPQDAFAQVAIYDDGVGTQSFKPLRALGGAFGWGLAKNVRQLYKHLAQTYQPGDKIYLFGFSRGAFTVRSLAGLIASKGILDIEAYPTDEALDLAVTQIYESYRSRHSALLEKLIYQPLMQFFYKPYGTAHSVHGDGGAEIEFIGVWDSVDAVGLPFDEATQFWNTFIFRFKFSDMRLNPLVKKACQAISIDDKRQTFRPLVWENTTNDPRIEQVWFPGVHANVGGGYPQQGLSLVALDWMMNKARASGLHFIIRDEDSVRTHQYVCDKLYDSRAGLAAYYRYLPRNIAALSTECGIAKPQIHVGAFHRVAYGIFGYAPGNLPTQFEVVDNNGPYQYSDDILRLVNPSDQGPNHAPLLDNTASLIKLRRLLYHVFLAYTAFTLHMVMWDDTKGHGFFGGIYIIFKTLVNPENMVDRLAVLFLDKPWLVVGGLVLFGCTVYLRKKMAKVFSLFWSPLRTGLRPLV
jgi:uncharacterized protein (DUF2235 family)